MSSAAVSARWSATGRSCATASVRSVPGGKTRSDQGHGAGPYGRFRLPGSRRWRPGSVPVPSEMDKVLHGDRVMARISGVDRRGRPEGSIVEVLEHVNAPGGASACRAWHPVRDGRKQAHQPGNSGARRRDGQGQAGQVVMVEIIAAARQACAAASGASPRCWAIMPIPAWKSRSPCASTTCRMNFRPRPRSSRGKACRRRAKKPIMEGREDMRDLPLVTIDGETARDFDDAVYLRTRAAAAWPAGGGDCRRQPLREAG